MICVLLQCIVYTEKIRRNSILSFDFIHNLCLFCLQVVKLRLARLKFSPVSLSQFSLAAKLDVLKHGPLLAGQIRSRIDRSPWL